MDEFSEDGSFEAEYNDDFEYEMAEEDVEENHLSESASDNIIDSSVNNLRNDPEVAKMLDDFKLEAVSNVRSSRFKWNKAKA